MIARGRRVVENRHVIGYHQSRLSGSVLKLLDGRKHGSHIGHQDPKKLNELTELWLWLPPARSAGPVCSMR